MAFQQPVSVLLLLPEVTQSKDTRRVISSDKYKSYNGVEQKQVYLKYSLLLEEIQYEGVVLSARLSLALLAEVMVNEKLLPETSKLENRKLQDHLLRKPYQIKCQRRTWSLPDGDTTKR